ncbi:MAG: hypothetical protein WC498_02135 [Candidatus Saccharimonadales bacterium]
MTFTDREFNELCGIVVESCGSKDPIEWQDLESFLCEQAYGSPDQDDTLATHALASICQTDAYRIRRGISEICESNAAARELGGPLLHALGLRSYQKHRSQKTR